MRTLKDLKENIEQILKEHPEWENLVLISSSDGEGNSYGKVYNDLSPAQVEDLKQWNLELVGFLGDEDFSISEKDINCICIN